MHLVICFLFTFSFALMNYRTCPITEIFYIIYYFLYLFHVSIQFNEHSKAHHITLVYSTTLKFLLLGRTMIFLVFLNILLFSKDPARQ